MSLKQVYIAGSDAGLHLDKKPFLQPDKAFVKLDNAYVWRDRVKKRQGLKTLGRLRRVLPEASIGLTGASPWSILNIYSTYTPPFVPEATAEIEPGSVIITIQAGPDIVFTDQGNGILTSPTPGNSGTINYLNGDIVLIHTAGPGVPAVASFSYFPGLPVMGISDREITIVNDEETIFFDTKYAYKFVGTGFQEYSAGTTWQGTDSDFFWTTNYRGSTADARLFFATNFFVNPPLFDPIRYTSGGAWTDFEPILADVPQSPAQVILYQAKILIPYYGRLLALNTYEGTTAGGIAGASNFFNRVRFSQIGSPIAVDAWRSDIFGKGGFIDAPTNEAIMSAIYFKNTLIVTFERSTWQLRYVGEYGLPFLWERISSDYGCESKMSNILFDEGVAFVGDKAIVQSNSVNVSRIDQQIPDLVFDFRNENNGIERVAGIRDFQRQLVFWNFCDSNSFGKFPNRVLVYNYMNQTYAIFRDNVTAWGTFQPSNNITWDSLDTFWDDDEILWDDFDTQSLFPNIIIGNQQGFISYYGYNSLDDPSLSITAVTLANPIILTIINHNLVSGEIIYLTGLQFVDGAFVPIATDLNERIFRVTRIDDDNISLSEWDGSAYIDNYVFTPSSGTYIGGGKVTLFPLMDIQTKDFNPFAQSGQQVKISYIDFLTDVPGNPDAAMSVQLLLNASPIAIGNVIVGNKNVEQYLPQPYYIQQSDYAWHRFFATTTGQYIKLRMFYDDALMNQLSTHTSDWVLNAISLYVREAGRNTF
jgi:hypothetical protein